MNFEMEWRTFTTVRMQIMSLWSPLGSTGCIFGGISVQSCDFTNKKEKNWVFKMLLKFILKLFFFFYQNTQIITLVISNYDKTWPNNSAE